MKKKKLRGWVETKDRYGNSVYTTTDKKICASELAWMKKLHELIRGGWDLPIKK